MPYSDDRSVLHTTHTLTLVDAPYPCAGSIRSGSAAPEPAGCKARAAATGGGREAHGPLCQATDTAEWRAAWLVDEIGLLRPLSAVSAGGACAFPEPMRCLRHSSDWRVLPAATTRGLAAAAAAATAGSDINAAGAALERAVSAVTAQLSVKLPLT